MDSISLLTIFASVLALAIAIIGHEIMHGYIAYKYGDMTAKNAGRLSINPISHVDMYGTIIVPALMYFIPMVLGMGSGFLFGWAKPVPINTQTVIKNGGYNAAMQVSLAGIVYNAVLAVFASMLLLSLDQPLQNDSLLYVFFYIFVMKLMLINIVLAIFNLLPIPQFDGAHFLMWLSLKYNMHEVAQTIHKLEPYGMFIAIGVLISPIKDYVLIAPIQFVLRLLLN